MGTPLKRPMCGRLQHRQHVHHWRSGDCCAVLLQQLGCSRQAAGSLAVVPVGCLCLVVFVPCVANMSCRGCALLQALSAALLVHVPVRGINTGGQCGPPPVDLLPL